MSVTDNTLIESMQTIYYSIKNMSIQYLYFFMIIKKKLAYIYAIFCMIKLLWQKINFLSIIKCAMMMVEILLLSTIFEK